MTRNEFARIFGGTIVFLTILLGILAIIQILRNSPIWGEAGAAWVQAVGSIVTIAVAWASLQRQLAHAEQSRVAEGARADKIHLEIALRLAKDVYGIQMDIHRKFVMNQTHYPGAKKKIGTERLEEMQLSLHNFMLRPLSPILYAELLVLIRELAFTRTAVRQQNELFNTSNQRVKRALKRANSVLKSRDRIQQLLNAS